MEKLNSLNEKYLKLKQFKETKLADLDNLKNEREFLNCNLQTLNAEINNIEFTIREIKEYTKKLKTYKLIGILGTIIPFVLYIITISVIDFTIKQMLASLFFSVIGSIYGAKLGFEDYLDVKEFLNINNLQALEEKLETKNNQKIYNREEYKIVNEKIKEVDNEQKEISIILNNLLYQITKLKEKCNSSEGKENKDIYSNSVYIEGKGVQKVKK